VFDRTLVTSGFDVEVLISEDYLTYLLLAQVEAGLLPLQTSFVDAASGHAETTCSLGGTTADPTFRRHPDRGARTGSLDGHAWCDADAALTSCSGASSDVPCSRVQT